MSDDQNNHGERLSRVEQSVKGLEDWMTGIDAKMERLLTASQSSSKTDWTMVFTGLMVVGALWAAAINPINKDVDKAGREADKLALAVIKQDAAVEKDRYDNLKATCDLDKRLSVLEFIVTHNYGEAKGSNVK